MGWLTSNSVISGNTDMACFTLSMALPVSWSWLSLPYPYTAHAHTNLRGSLALRAF